MAVALLNWLIEPARAAEWSLAAHVLPTRAAALASWGDSPYAPLAAAVLTRAEPQPSTRVLGVIGPALHEAVGDVLAGRATPEAAAETAVQAVAAAQP
jgi:ABC-type glycerol-3-phosphate transport system substrate-binding protein